MLRHQICHGTTQYATIQALHCSLFFRLWNLVYRFRADETRRFHRGIGNLHQCDIFSGYLIHRQFGSPILTVFTHWGSASVSAPPVPRLACAISGHRGRISCFLWHDLFSVKSRSLCPQWNVGLSVLTPSIMRHSSWHCRGFPLRQWVLNEHSIREVRLMRF